MKFNKVAVRNELDKAAEALDSLGFTDLADKVDYCNNKLAKANSGNEIKLIRRMLARVEQEAKKRQEGCCKKEEEKKVATLDKDKLRELKAKRVSEKKGSLRERIQQKLQAKRDAAQKTVEKAVETTKKADLKVEEKPTEKNSKLLARLHRKMRIAKRMKELKEKQAEKK